MKIKTVKQRKLEQQAAFAKQAGFKFHKSLYFKTGGIITTKVDDATGEKIPTGFLSSFGNRDSHKDVIHKGAYTKSLRERGPESSTHRKIAFLAHHQMETPIGQFKKLEELETGLYYEGKFDGIPYVKETIIPQLESGTLNQHSIGYNYVFETAEYDEEKDEFHWFELELFEGSVVTLGANDNTPFTGFKEFQQLDQISELADKANTLLRTLGDYKKEFELRDILQKYQSLLEYAADEITANKKKPRKADLKYLVDNFKL